jgi:hypothetical protein
MTTWGTARALFAVVLVCAACATEGPGSTPPLPGQPSISGDSDPVGDDGAVAGDDGGTTDGALPSDSGTTCNDLLHGLRAVFVQTPMPCTNGATCPSGDCCYAGPLSSTCVMQ